MKILIVDDIHYNLLLLERTLKSLGHQVIKSLTAQEALRTLELISDIDVVITDYAMPGKDGLELKKACHQKLRIEMGRKMPHFVMLSAYATEEISNKAKRNGFIEIMKKPFKRNEIEACLFELSQSSPSLFTTVKKILIYSPDQLIQEALEKSLPEENLCIYWFSDLLQALDCYKNEINLSAVFCTQVCNGTSALDLIELCQQYKLFDDTGILKPPSFHIVMNNTSVTEEDTCLFLDKSKQLKVDNILYYPISSNKIRQAFNIPLATENELVEDEHENKILIIEDTAVTRLMIEKSLKKSGYKVISCETGYDALRHLREDPDIRLVICDLNLPDMQGDEILQEYEEMQQLTGEINSKKAEFILMTMSREDEILESALYKNFVQLLHKPLNLLELEGIIESILNKKDSLLNTV